MVARTQVVSSFRNLNSLGAYAQRFPQEAQAAARRTYNRVAPQLQRELSFAPPRPRRRIEWTTERQRRAYFATNGFGRGIPSRRTGGATKQWRVLFVASGSVFTIHISNPNNYVVYVNYNKPNQRSRIQRFHRITGWVPVNPAIDRARRRARLAFSEELAISRRKRR